MVGQIQAATDLKAQWQSLVGAPQPAQQAVAATSSAIPRTPMPPPAAESPSAPPSAGPVLHHIVINATTLTYRQLSVHVTAASHGAANAPTPSPAPQTASAPQSDNHPAVERVDSDAFGALRARSVDRSSETALTLNLTA